MMGNHDYLVDIQADSIVGMVYSQNQIKGNATTSNGTKISANTIKHSIINKNMTTNLKKGGTLYKFPSSTKEVMISENR